jgi:hypothetical protein
MLSEWFCWCCNSDYMPVCWANGSVAVARAILYARMLSVWFCCCFRRLTAVGSALRYSQTFWRTAQSAPGRAAACVSRWSRGAHSSCRGTVFLPTPHSTPASPPFCASVGSSLILFLRPETISAASCTYHVVLKAEHTFRRAVYLHVWVKGRTVRNWLSYIGTLKRRRSLRSTVDEERWTNRGEREWQAWKSAFLQERMLLCLRKGDPFRDTILFSVEP